MLFDQLILLLHKFINSLNKMKSYRVDPYFSVKASYMYIGERKLSMWNPNSFRNSAELRNVSILAIIQLRNKTAVTVWRSSRNNLRNSLLFRIDKNVRISLK